MMKKKCINCEVRGEEVEATHEVRLLGDVIPLCEDCYDDFKSASIIDDEDDKD